MHNLSRQINLSADLPVSTAGGRSVTPSSVGNSIFKKVLQDLNQGEEASCGGLNLLFLDGGGNAAASKGISFLKGRGGTAGRLVLGEEGVRKLTAYLREKGFSGEEIEQFLLSIKDAGGGVPLDRLLAKLDALHRAGEKGTDGKVVDAVEIPKVEEALFKMGLKAEEVDQAIRGSLNEQGRLALGRLTHSLGSFFTGIRPETQEVLAAALSKHFDIHFGQGNDRAASMNGVKDLLSGLTEEASRSARKTVKAEIAALLREKGIPPEEVTRFLETLKVGKDPQVPVEGRTKNSSKSSAEQPLAGIYIRKDGSDFGNGDWKERVMGLLQKEHAHETRTDGAAAGQAANLHGKTAGAEKDLLLHQQLFGKDVRNPADPFSGATRNNRTAVLHAAEGKGPADTRTGKTTEAAPTTRPAHGFDLSNFRADRTASQTTVNTRGPASAVSLPEPLPKIVDRMVWMVRAGEQKSRLHISPPELGRLDLDIVIRQGHLHAHLNAENPLAKELIEANIQQLRQQLNNLGFVVERFDVHAGLDERRFMGGNDGSWAGKRGRRSSSGSREDGSFRVGSLEASRRSTSGDGRVDVLV